MRIRMRFEQALDYTLRRLARNSYKNFRQLKYWQRRLRDEGSFGNGHFEYFFTTVFGLSRSDYVGRRVLDIGCGPRGSLEWAADIAQCIGIDPLLPEYRTLGIAAHRMTYVHAGAEKIPFPNGHFDIVSSFVNLVYVDDVGKAVAEIKRVTAAGGTLLLITKVLNQASGIEPHALPRNVAAFFEPEFSILRSNYCRLRNNDIYQSIRDNEPFAGEGECAAFARLVRLPSPLQ